MSVMDEIRAAQEEEKRIEWEKFGPYSPPRSYTIKKWLPLCLSLLIALILCIYFGVVFGLQASIIFVGALIFIFVLIPLLFDWLSKKMWK